MTTFKTGNPLGSTAVKDLYDNAENLDAAVNDRTTESWIDRLGFLRRTWHGMERFFLRFMQDSSDQFQRFLVSSGYEDIGNYGPGLLIERRNQIFWRDGELYRAGAALELPYTTTGNWGEEGNHFVAIGDAALRQQLADADDPSNGAGMVAFDEKNSVLSALGNLTDPRGSKPQYSIEGKIVYCSPTGDDNNDGTIGSPLKTIQEAVNRCPKYLRHTYVIDLIGAAPSLPAVYDEDVLIDSIESVGNFFDAAITSRFIIQGTGPNPNDSNPNDCRVGSITMVNCRGVATPWIYGIQLQRASPYYEQSEYVGAYACDEIAVQNLSFSGIIPAVGVRCYGSKATIKLSNFDGCTNAVWAKRNAQISISDCVGTTSLSAHRAEEGSWIAIFRNGINADKINGTTVIVGGGGFFVDQAGNFIKPVGVYVGMPKQTELVGNLGAVGANTVAMGYLFDALQSEGVCIGYQATLLASGGVVVGAGATVEKIGGTAIGRSASSREVDATAIGAGAVAQHTNSAAIGRNAYSRVSNQVVLGNGCSVLADSDYECNQVGRGLIAKSPNGSRYRIRVNDSGAVEAVLL